MEKKLKNQITRSLRTSTVPMNNIHLQKTKELVGEQFTIRSRKEPMRFGTFLLLQVKHLAWKIWFVQGVILAILCGGFLTVFGEFILYSPRQIALLLCCVAMLVFMTAVPFIQRSIQYQMHEIESATKFSTVKLLVAKLLIIGIGDGIMLMSLFYFVIFHSSLAGSSVILYLLLPFLVISSGCLYLLGHVSADKFTPYSSGLCISLFLVIVAINRFYPSVLEQTFSLRWMCVCIGLVVFCSYQIRYLIVHSSYTEMQFT